MISKKITDHIINLIESIEECKLLNCCKSRGHFMFYSSSQYCFISCMYDKQKQEIHLLYAYPMNIEQGGSSDKRIIKIGRRK